MKLADFEGRWRLVRDIVSADAPGGTFEGTAVWRDDGTGLAYAEEGILTLEGHAPIHAERRYLWRADLDVYFEDGRFFHRVPVDGSEAVHDCPPDLYRVRYDFADWSAWQTEWRVTGPRKDYRMVSRYIR